MYYSNCVCPSVPVVVFRIVGVVEWGIHVRRQWRGHGVICLPLEVMGQPVILFRWFRLQSANVRAFQFVGLYHFCHYRLLNLGKAVSQIQRVQLNSSALLCFSLCKWRFTANLRVMNTLCVHSGVCDGINWDVNWWFNLPQATIWMFGLSIKS